MELLRFDDAGSNSPRRKKSSRGMLAVGLVATLFGISSAFASSTISINSNAPIALGQGVSAVTACDESISLSPSTSMRLNEDENPEFYLDHITLSDIDLRAIDATKNIGDDGYGLGCAGKSFDLQIFDKDNAAYDCTEIPYARTNIITENSGPLSYDGCVGSTVTITLPTVVANPTPNANASYQIDFSDAPAEVTYFTLVSRS